MHAPTSCSSKYDISSTVEFSFVGTRDCGVFNNRSVHHRSFFRTCHSRFVARLKIVMTMLSICESLSHVHLPIIGHIPLEGYVYKMSARKRRKARFETLAYSGEIMPTKFAMNPSPRPNRDLQLASQPHTGRSCQICPKIHGFFFWH